jgi:cell division protein FtsB
MPLITAAFLSYFGFHAFNGYYGIWAMDRLEGETKRLATELETLKRERVEFERRVALLRTDNLDADVVDVEARAALNRLRPDEIVIKTVASPQVPQ